MDLVAARPDANTFTKVSSAMSQSPGPFDRQIQPPPQAPHPPGQPVQDPRFDPQREPSIGLPVKALLVVAVVLLFVVAGAVFAVVEGTLPSVWHQQRALDHYTNDNLPGAIEEMSRAIEWTPDDPALYMARGVYREESGDLEGALEDFNHFVELSPSNSLGYRARGNVLQRLGRHDEALADADMVISLRPEWEAAPLNNRAYMRAIAGVDLQEALEDVELALERTDEGDRARASYLDTRGYILFLLDRPEEALEDMNLAIELAEKDYEQQLQFWENQGGDDKLRKPIQRRLEQSLAVLYKHRAAVYEKLGDQSQAEFNHRRAEQLGYDPDSSIY